MAVSKTAMRVVTQGGRKGRQIEFLQVTFTASANIPLYGALEPKRILSVSKTGGTQFYKISNSLITPRQ